MTFHSKIRRDTRVVAGQFAASNRTARTWRLLQKRLEDIFWDLCETDAFRLHRTLVEAAKGLEDVQFGLGRLPELWRCRTVGGDGTMVYEDIRILAEHCSTCAEREEREFSRLRIQGFRDWARAAVKVGGGAAHAYAKVLKARPGRLGARRTAPRRASWPKL